MSKHTPGPWETKSGVTVLGPKDEFGVYRLVAVCDSADNDIEEAQANASLIAAAPDLLEAAIKCLAEFDKCTVFNANGSPFESMRYAIAKAEGKNG